MSSQQYIINKVDWETNKIPLQSIRTQVFVEEQKVPVEEEWDSEDGQAIHFLASDKAGNPVGTVRLLKSGQIGRMAVLEVYRGQGIGDQLLLSAINWALANQETEIFLHAQTHALGFYQKHGFAAQGEEFMDAGIPHFSMTYSADNGPDNTK